MVTRWRMTQPMPQGDNAPLLQQTVVCVQTIPAGSARHAAEVSVTMRLWGPAPAKAWHDSFHHTGSTWAGRPTASSVRVSRVTTRRMGEVHAGTEGPNQVLSWGGIAFGGYPAGTYSEV